MKGFGLGYPRGAAAAARRLRLAALGAAIASLVVGAGSAGAASGPFPGPPGNSDRAYELVTPPFGDADICTAAGTLEAVSAGGDTVCFASSNNPAGPPVGDEMRTDGYCAHRGAAGWSNEWVTAPYGIFQNSGTFGPRILFSSEDGRRHVFLSDRRLNEGIRTNTHGYLRADGETTWVTGPNGPGTHSVFRIPLAADADVTRIAFEAEENLVPEDTNGVTDVYLWEDGETTLVSKKADGTAAGGQVPRAAPPMHARQNPMSSDGSRLFFSSSAPLVDGAPDGVASVYVSDGETVDLASPRRGPDGTPPQAVEFVGASDNGRIIYLSTAEQLTEEAKDAGTAIYRYDLDSDELELVASGGGIQPYAVSDDGSSVFYLATEGVASLWVSRDGAKELVAAPLLPFDGLPYRVTASSPHQRALKISPDGRVVVFASASPIVAGAMPGVLQVYRWESGGELTRVSPAPVGEAEPALSSIGNFVTPLPFYPGRFDIVEQVTNWQLGGRVMTADGEAVFFDSLDQLVLEDQNAFNDVYEWRDGQVRLISTGTADGHAFYLGNSADGDTVFFTTWQRILPLSDRNDVRDVYAARVGGGFPQPQPGTVGLPPAPLDPGSAPPANPIDSASARPPESLPGSSLRLAGIRANEAKGRISLVLRLDDGGRVVARAFARIDGKRRLVARIKRKVAAGSKRVVVPLKLSRRALAQLRAKGKLRVVVAVALVGGDGERRRAIVLRSGGGDDRPRGGAPHRQPDQSNRG